jgi:hypothetical protein
MHYFFWIVLISLLATCSAGSEEVLDHSDQEFWPELIFDKPIEFNQVTIKEETTGEALEAVYRIQYWTGNHWRNIQTDNSLRSGKYLKFIPVVSQRVRLLLASDGLASKATIFTVHNKRRGMEESGFVLPQRDPHLPNVLLCGDSITQQYAPYVVSNLTGIANTYQLPPRHDWDSKNFIPAIKQLKQLLNPEIKWDIIHFNFGLHDMKRYNHQGKKDRENGAPQVESDAYARNLQNALDWLSEHYPQAKLIFATTTPVPEGEPRRRSVDSMRYNRIARQILSQNPEVAINDLYGYTLPNHAKWQIAPGNVHFNEAGKRTQGKLVAEIIRKALH